MITTRLIVNVVDGFGEAVYYIEMLVYIVQGNLKIRIHRDITGEMWFGAVVNYIL